MRDLRVLSREEAKRRFENSSGEESNEIMRYLGYNALKRKLQIATMQSDSGKFELDELKNVRDYTQSLGYKTIYVIGLSHQDELIVACSQS